MTPMWTAGICPYLSSDYVSPCLSACLSLFPFLCVSPSLFLLLNSPFPLSFPLMIPVAFSMDPPFTSLCACSVPHKQTPTPFLLLSQGHSWCVRPVSGSFAFADLDGFGTLWVYPIASCISCIHCTAVCT